jgi:DNA adenine methylase
VRFPFCPRQNDKKMMSTEAKPFLKWAGGKGQLLSQLDEHLPEVLQNHEFIYIEPFVGGGAMLFHMLRQFPNITHAVINDINPHLVTAYRVIKEQPGQLINRLSALEQEYFSQPDEEAKREYFLNVRNIFNEVELDDIDRTKYLMFLNRTCFNGLYRVNGKGKFNVPFGRNLHPTICNADTILADSEALNRADVTILNGDFERTADEMRDGLNFFYFDPPYRPLNATSSFNSYVKEEFNDDEQTRLRDFCARLNEQTNVRWMLSNSDCSAKNPEDTFFEDIYADFNIHRVYASRAINANPSKRGKLTELLIKNYE